MPDTAGFDQLIMPAGHLGRATIGRTLGFVGIGQSCENYRGIGIGRVWIGQNFPDLLTLSSSAFV
jgi:hypothetical protein